MGDGYETKKSSPIHAERAELEELRRRLEEAEQTIEAIRRGEVDAVVGVGDDGNSIYTLEGPDHPYHNIVETMNAGAVTIDSQGTIFYSNTVFSEMIGLPLETVIGSCFNDLVVPEDLPLFLDFLTKACTAGKTTQEISIRTSSDPLCVRLAGSSQTACGIQRVSLVVTDVSDLKRTEELLRREARAAQNERDRISTLVDSMNEAVLFSDPTGRVVFANAAAKAHAVELGIDSRRMVGRPLSALFSKLDILSLPGLKPLTVEPLLTAAIFQGKGFNNLEVAVLNGKKGEMIYRRISASPVGGVERGQGGAITVVQDITAQKRADEEKAQLEENLRQAQKMEAIGTLAGGIAHDFNNMLAVILGNAELALDDLEEAEGPRRNLEQIIKASKRARDLVKQILTFSRKGEAGKKPLRLTPLVKETLNLLRNTLPTTTT